MRSEKLPGPASRPPAILEGVLEDAAEAAERRHRKFGHDIVLRTPPEVLETARQLAAGDASRLVLHLDGSILVANNAKQARRLRSS